MHFGIITPPVPGHIHPFGALGRELIRRGHRVTVFHMADLAERVRREGLEFVAVGASDHPAGTLPDSLARLARLDGLAALRFTVDAVRETSEMTLRDAPNAIRQAGIEALLVDQMEPAGGTIAEHLDIPFVTVCNALLLNEEAGVPPPFTGWPLGQGLLPQLRNQAGYAIGRLTMLPVQQTVDRYRSAWKLPPLHRPADSFSRRAQICQQPAAFDFPRRHLPPSFHYVGPLRGPATQPVPFPWEQIDGRPLVYASLGTLQNRRAGLFHIFAEACRDLDLQLVMTHGGGLAEEAAREFSGRPIVVPYAPQLEVLARASLTLTHAGLNTVLDSLNHGVPLVALPITYEQPAIASRIRWLGVGEVLPLGRANVARVRKLLSQVLSEPLYRQRAKEISASIRVAGGVERAADIIQNCLQNSLRN